MLKSGNYAAIYVPALQAKDAALEIQTRHTGARGVDQDALEANVKQIVLAAYQLDNYGDIGRRPQGARRRSPLSTPPSLRWTRSFREDGNDALGRGDGSSRGRRSLRPSSAEAHKGITSKFTYNAEVYPIFLNRCGRCHVDGGVGPMSLLKYEDAFPWAESLRTELLAAFSEDGPARRSPKAGGSFIKAAHRQISARELDIILDWATGGTPEGDKAKTPPQSRYTNEWSRGTPNLTIAMPEPLRDCRPTRLKQTQEFVLPIPVDQPHSAGQLDLLPGNAAIVRSAAISIRSKDGQIRTLGTWFPRQTPAPLALKPVARLEPGSELIARIHYKKTWKFEGKAMSDRSTVGFYFAD